MRGHNQKKDTHTLDFDVTLTPQRGGLTLQNIMEIIRKKEAKGSQT